MSVPDAYKFEKTDVKKETFAYKVEPHEVAMATLPAAISS
jgi:hypothetical protein